MEAGAPGSTQCVLPLTLSAAVRVSLELRKQGCGSIIKLRTWQPMPTWAMLGGWTCTTAALCNAEPQMEAAPIRCLRLPAAHLQRPCHRAGGVRLHHRAGELRLLHHAGGVRLHHHAGGVRLHHRAGGRLHHLAGGHQHLHLEAASVATEDAGEEIAKADGAERAGAIAKGIATASSAHVEVRGKA